MSMSWSSFPVFLPHPLTSKKQGVCWCGCGLAEEFRLEVFPIQGPLFSLFLVFMLTAPGLPSSLYYFFLAGPHLNLLLQLPLEVFHLLGVGELPSGQLGDQRLLFFQLPGQLTWRWECGFVSHRRWQMMVYPRQTQGWFGTPTILSL